MGCCLSSTTGQHPNAAKAPNNHLSPVMSRPSLEEETVKEVVISETPPVVAVAPKPQAPDDGHGLIMKHDIPEPEEEVEAKHSEVNSGKLNTDTEDGGGRALGAMVAQEDGSEYSEMCSISESLSTTTTITELRDDEVISLNRDRPRDFTGRKIKRSLPPVKAPTPPLRERYQYASREGNPNNRQTIKCSSPGPRSGIAQQNRRSSPTRTQGVATTMARTPMRPYNSGNAGSGYDPGRNSYRRSRSPAMRRSPSRIVVTETSVGNNNNKENLDQENRGKNAEKVVEENKGDVPKKGNDRDRESLENPLVSLECFIFI